MVKRNSFTLIELMGVVVIVSIVISIGIPIVRSMNENIMMSRTRLTLQQDARNVMSILNRFLREAKASSIVVSRYDLSQPFCSYIRFTTIDSKTYEFYQSGKKLVLRQSNMTKILSEDVRYLAFTFPDSSNMYIVSVSITFERELFAGRKKAIHVASEKIRIMND
ncbi:MAG: prepilin-type N-terminal cleavage/methylation domain-containing protein [Elusimicrobiales bacterium]|nr:prepilin-type N-terminal cleavage/methylation domain-containing protein [Elusimicrobiales bacterium]